MVDANEAIPQYLLVNQHLFLVELLVVYGHLYLPFIIDLHPIAFRMIAGYYILLPPLLSLSTILSHYD